ncbi:MAG: glycosyltransferase family 4 protein [Candidatus Doudnabacteria bacterium]|nr:glycosyltransferase family 4 protein [Candidatus Doudnabacteria bacterium]
MVIGLEATGYLNRNPTGIAHYTREIIAAITKLKHTEIVHFYKLSRWKQRRLRLVAPNNRWHFGNINLNFKKIDISHTLDNHFLNVRNSRKIITIHDLAAAKPENQINQYSSHNARETLLRKIEFLNKNSDGFITVSNATKVDLMELCDVSDSKIKVVHIAPVKRQPNNQDEENILSQFKLKSKQYLLFVGSISIRKNLLNLIHAYAAGKFDKDYELVLAGSFSMGAESIVELIHHYKLQDRVKILGYVPDDYLNALYKHSQAFLFPTYYEGFGIPIVEAMLSGVPVLIGNRGAAPEIADGNAILSDPFSVESISDGIRKTIEFPATAIEKAKLHAEQFTWERTANKTMEYYMEILGK